MIAFFSILVWVNVPRCAYTYAYIITIHREELQEQKYYKMFLSGALLIYRTIPVTQGKHKHRKTFFPFREVPRFCF